MNNVEFVLRYIRTRPWLKEALRQRVVTYSRVARMIMKDVSTKEAKAAALTLPALTIALQRYAQRLHRRQSGDADLPAHLLAKAKLQVRNRMAVCVIERPRDLDSLHALQKKVRSERGDFLLIERDHAVVVILNQDYVSVLNHQYRGRVLSTEVDLAQVLLVFDKRIETTPGVVAFVYGLLAERGINVREEVSCWTDLMVMIEERSLPQTLEALRVPG